MAKSPQSRPLLIVDCDEVLLHMVVPFREWLDEEHGIHFDLGGAGNFGEALRHKASGDVVEREMIWTLLSAFFKTEMHRQTPFPGAVPAIERLAAHADIVVLTNIGPEAEAARAAQLAQCGIEHRVIGNFGGKGPPLARLVAEYQPSVTVFVDDIEHNHISVAEHAPATWRLQMIGEPALAPLIAPAATAHARIDNWAEAEPWIMARFGEAAGAPDIA